MPITRDPSPPAPPAAPAAAAAAGDTPPPVLQVRDLARDFEGIRAVRGVSFDIQPGTVTGLIGPNGAGKTTTFAMIAGELPPSSGSIRFRGEEVTALAAHQMFRRGLARTFQIPRPFARMTVLENLMTAPLAQRGERFWINWLAPWTVTREERRLRDRAREVLRFLDLDRLGEEAAGNLSGGQMKLLELGRALMADPALILLDEPAAGVNPVLLESITGRVRELHRQGISFLVIEHNMDVVAELCDPVLVMTGGELLRQGSCREISADPLVVEAFLGGSPPDPDAADAPGG